MQLGERRQRSILQKFSKKEEMSLGRISNAVGKSSCGDTVPSSGHGDIDLLWRQVERL